MSEFNDNLWAPWRMQYIRSLCEEANEKGCFLCDYGSHPESDGENHVVWRTQQCLAVMNRFPYTNGHLMIAPLSHVGELEQLSDETIVQMALAVRDGVALLKDAVSAQGFNVGYNIGVCAGAGLPEHIHAHIVPRWHGDTNYMAVLGKARVIPDALDALYETLMAGAKRLGLGLGEPPVPPRLKGGQGGSVT